MVGGPKNVSNSPFSRSYPIFPIALAASGGGGSKYSYLEILALSLLWTFLDIIIFLNTSLSKIKKKIIIKITMVQPGFEPVTSCTQSRNHTTRPLSFYKDGSLWQSLYNFIAWTTEMTQFDFSFLIIESRPLQDSHFGYSSSLISDYEVEG